MPTITPVTDPTPAFDLDTEFTSAADIAKIIHKYNFFKIIH